MGISRAFTPTGRATRGPQAGSRQDVGWMLAGLAPWGRCDTSWLQGCARWAHICTVAQDSEKWQARKLRLPFPKVGLGGKKIILEGFRDAPEVLHAGMEV